MSSNKQFPANFGPQTFRPVDRDLKNFGPTPSEGKVDPTKKPPFTIGGPAGQKPPVKEPGKGKKG